MKKWKYVKRVAPRVKGWVAILPNGVNAEVPEELWPLLNAAYGEGAKDARERIRMAIGAAGDGSC